jgi:regulatory LuxR family protein
MAEGRDNVTIADTLVITERAVSKHIGNVFLKLGLPPTDSGHRSVLAVLAYLHGHVPPVTYDPPLPDSTIGYMIHLTART